MMSYVKGMVAGGILTYAGLYFIGHVPLWFGPESHSWSKAELEDHVLEEIENIQAEGFWKHRPKGSTRNFLEVHNSTAERRVRKMLYFDRSRGIVRGVVKFGADVEGPPRCVHGGCSAAVVDGCLGVLAYKVALMPCLTVNLNINYRNKIPLGSAVAVECKLDKIEGKKVFLSFTVSEISSSRTILLDGTALFLKADVSFIM